MSTPTAAHLAKSHMKGLIYRCQHRGVKELDLLLGGFAKKHLAELTPSQLLLFEKLLECPENYLLEWITGVEPAPKEYQSEVFDKIAKFAQNLEKN